MTAAATAEAGAVRVVPGRSGATLPAWGAVEQRRLARRARRCRHRCRYCRRRITDAVSLRFMIGSGCRRKLGITTGRRLQMSRIRVRDPGHVTGQLVLPLGPMGIIR